MGVTLFIALAAAALSYDHALDVAEATGTEPPAAYLVPLLADGLIVLSSAGLYEAAQSRSPRPGWATLGLVLGVGVTLVLNVAAGWHHGWGGRLLNALAPVALIVAIEVLIGIFRRGRNLSETYVSDTSDVESGPAEPVPVHDALARLTLDYSQRELAAALDLPRSTVQRKWPRLATAAVNGDGNHG